MVDVELTDRLEAVKIKIQRGEGFPPGDQRFIDGDRQMEDENTLGDYGVTFGALVQMVLLVRR